MNVEPVSWLDYKEYSPKQRLASEVLFSHPRANLLYGGAGFGGKSRWLRNVAGELNGELAQRGFPSPWGILLCKVGEDLRKRHLAKIQEEYAGMGEVKEDRTHGLSFHFYDKELGGFYLSHLEDADRLRSAEFAWALVDELTECTRDDFGKIRYSIRSPKKLPWLPFAAGSNPDGIGHPWVRKLWIDRDFSGDDTALDPDSFFFVSALAEDNPTWSHDMEASQFGGLAEAIRIARRTGSWDVIGDTRYPMFDRRVHVYEFQDEFPRGVPATWRKYRCVDYGVGEPFCCLWFAVDEDRNIWVYREVYKRELPAWEQAREIIELTPESEKITMTYMDPACWQRFPQHFGKTDHSVAKFYFQSGVKPITPANNDRLAGWEQIANYLSEGNGLPNLRIASSCTNLIRTLAALPMDKRTTILSKGGDVDPRAEDHAPDALRYGLLTYVRPPSGYNDLPTEFSTDEERSDHVSMVQSEFFKEIDRRASKRIAKQFKFNR